MFADDANLFYEQKNVIKLFATLNEELINKNDLVISNKFSNWGSLYENLSWKEHLKYTENKIAKRYWINAQNQTFLR